MTKKLLIIILIVVVATGAILGYFWWQKSGEKGIEEKVEKQTEPESVKQVMIPSSLDSEQVIVDFAAYTRVFGYMVTREDSFWTDFLGIAYPNEGFIEGGITPWQGKENYYVKKDGTKIEGPDDPLSFIVAFAVFKYEKPEFTQEDYDKISTEQEFKDFILEGAELKIKVGLPPALERDIQQMSEIKLKSEQFQQYLLQSNLFIIYAVGLREAAEDVMIRVIDQYAVE